MTHVEVLLFDGFDEFYAVAPYEGLWLVERLGSAALAREVAAVLGYERRGSVSTRRSRQGDG